jgi:glutamate--cysteine ligase
VKTWTSSERQKLRDEVPRSALQTRFRDTSVQDLARETLRIARFGLRNRKQINVLSQDETIYLALLEEHVASGKTVADELLERYEGPWRRNIDHIFEEFAF